MIKKSIIPSMENFRNFFKLESASAIILFLTAILALILDNSPLSGIYRSLLNVNIDIRIHELFIGKPLLLWINDGLMATFFLLVGLELKREFLEGELSNASAVVLPGVAAVGGMVVPALIYAWINWGYQSTLNGWAIPAATDIAFALGVLSLFGKRVPLALKLFLLSLAIFDDLGAIIIIAVFHTASLTYTSLFLGFLAISVLALLNIFKVRKLTAYAIVGLILWVCLLKSGVHATLAGVVLAFFIPLSEKPEEKQPSPLRRLEEALHPWVAFLVMPLFAFANSGISFTGLTFKSLLEPVPLGIIAGLFFGKQIGIMIFSWITVKLGFSKLPNKTTWLSMYAVSLICGIGFTMSIFIGTLAFQFKDPAYLMQLRLGVLSGSLLSGVCGFLVLKYSLRKMPAS